MTVWDLLIVAGAATVLYQVVSLALMYSRAAGWIKCPGHAWIEVMYEGRPTVVCNYCCITQEEHLDENLRR